MDLITKEAIRHAKNLHFTGIGGVSISSLAILAKMRGYDVSGSDRARGALALKCEETGIKVTYSHKSENADNCDVLIYTAAVNMENPELARAKERGIPLVSRAEFLGYIMEDYKERFGISGTHGKTTTTSMLSHIFIEAGLDPTVANGAVTSELGGTLGIGGKEYFIYESCEYKDSFLSFFPTTAIITNIELDHTDYYPCLEKVIESFSKSIIPAERIIINADDENALKVSQGFTKEIIKISFENSTADYFTRDLRYENGRGLFTLCQSKNGKIKNVCEIKLSVIGAFNVYNSLCAAAAALEVGISPEIVSSALASFMPAKRRFEVKCEKKGIMIADDYAHHPSEIAATLKGVKNIDEKRIILIFQPHTYSRTHDLFDSFVSALSLADVTILADIYAARERDTLGVSSELLASKIDGALYFDSFEKIKSYILSVARQGDIILTMGAGDVYKIGDELIDLI